MEQPMNEVNERNVAEGLFRGVVLIADYMREANQNLLDTLMDPSERETAMHGSFLRAASWMMSLKKLKHPSDVQAIVTCNRSLLEITVDIILLHGDKTEAAASRMYWWEESAKLKSAEAIVAYYSKGVPDAYSPQIGFIANRKAMIEAQRTALWNGRHPIRWTDRNLLEDVREADRVPGAEVGKERGHTLTEYYETEYRRMNWYVHGSALASVRGLAPATFVCVCGLAFKACSDLAWLCTKLILTDFGFAKHLPGIEDQWEGLRQERLLAYGDAIGVLAKDIELN
jgi:hypothetical protein